MAERRFLRNAPIREAIIDLKIVPKADPERIEKFAKSLIQRFPSQGLMKQSAFGFEIGPDRLSSSYSDGGVLGHRLASPDNKCIVQLRIDGFTFSRLPPYESWEAMTEQAKPLWDDYVTHSGAERVARAAVRYINLIDLPLTVTDFGDYLRAPPVVPANLPQELSSFFTQIAIENHQIGSTALVTQALESSVENKVQVILDIDVFQETIEKDLHAKDPLVWIILDQMRNFKNQVFFESITERTAEMFA